MLKYTAEHDVNDQCTYEATSQHVYFGTVKEDDERMNGIYDPFDFDVKSSELRFCFGVTRDVPYDHLVCQLVNILQTDGHVDEGRPAYGYENKNAYMIIRKRESLNLSALKFKQMSYTFPGCPLPYPPTRYSPPPTISASSLGTVVLLPPR
jgi:hypothetical protein